MLDAIRSYLHVVAWQPQSSLAKTIVILAIAWALTVMALLFGIWALRRR